VIYGGYPDAKYAPERHRQLQIQRAGHVWQQNLSKISIDGIEDVIIKYRDFLHKITRLKDPNYVESIKSNWREVGKTKRFSDEEMEQALHEFDVKIEELLAKEQELKEEIEIYEQALKAIHENGGPLTEEGMAFLGGIELGAEWMFSPNGAIFVFDSEAREIVSLSKSLDTQFLKLVKNQLTYFESKAGDSGVPMEGVFFERNHIQNLLRSVRANINGDIFVSSKVILETEYDYIKDLFTVKNLEETLSFYEVKHMENRVEEPTIALIPENLILQIAADQGLGFHSLSKVLPSSGQITGKILGLPQGLLTHAFITDSLIDRLVRLERDDPVVVAEKNDIGVLLEKRSPFQVQVSSDLGDFTSIYEWVENRIESAEPLGKCVRELAACMDAKIFGSLLGPPACLPIAACSDGLIKELKEKFY